ncbi:MAG: gamma-glutamyl-gamma-aminobutyrate hydrolase family protein [Actinomycetota bacterium]|nr:gamma-glutamyl-gamma-aminobutyrate hydrolase family protein [Actinomycetota bacterium]
MLHRSRANDGHVVVVGQWREGQGGRIPVPYMEAIHAAGGTPKLFSTFEAGREEAVPAHFEAEMGLAPDDSSPLGGATGLVLPGGGDIDPQWYGRPRHPKTHNLNTRRDEFERTLLAGALERDIPILAICHGMQLLNVHFGGTLHQHLSDDPRRLEHDVGNPTSEPAHSVRLKERCVLTRYFDSAVLEVNSHHHQGLDAVPGALEEVGWAEDGVLEAVVAREYSWVVGVQWHPEIMAPHFKAQRNLFEAFVDATFEYTRDHAAKATA